MTVDRSPVVAGIHHAQLPEEMRERLESFVRAAGKGGLARKTVAALEGDGGLFADWCAGHGASWLPATPDTVAAFVEDIGEGRAVATVERYLSSIAMWHNAAGVANPCTALVVKMAVRALAASKGRRQRQARPVGAAELAEILAAMDHPEDIVRERKRDPGLVELLILRDKALLLAAHDTLCRAAELVELRWDDMEMSRDADGSATILVRRSKTDQEGEGAAKWLSPPTVAALLAWRQGETAEIERRRLLASSIEEAPPVVAKGRRGRPRKHPLGAVKVMVPEESPYLFRSLANRKWHAPMSADAVADVVRRWVWQAGHFETGYSAHSTRVGACQDLLAAGVDLLGVMQAGNWNSPAMPKRYGERILAGRGAVAQQWRRTRPPEASD